MLTINSISLSKGGKEILKDISVYMGPNEKIGLVGVNGAGKSTLLKILAKVEEADLGSIDFRGTISYLSQEVHKDILYEFEHSEKLSIGEVSNN